MALSIEIKEGNLLAYLFGSYPSVSENCSYLELIKAEKFILDNRKALLKLLPLKTKSDGLVYSDTIINQIDISPVAEICTKRGWNDILEYYGNSTVEYYLGKNPAPNVMNRSFYCGGSRHAVYSALLLLDQLLNNGASLESFSLWNGELDNKYGFGSHVGFVKALTEDGLEQREEILQKRFQDKLAARTSSGEIAR